MYRGESPRAQSLRYCSGLAVLDLRDLQTENIPLVWRHAISRHRDVAGEHDGLQGAEDFASKAKACPRPSWCSHSYLRAAQAYMLISMPTCTSAIFGFFHIIGYS
jgi:hypothetical protein